MKQVNLIDKFFEVMKIIIVFFFIKGILFCSKITFILKKIKVNYNYYI